MKKIKLGKQEKFALVDDADFKWLNKLKWCAAKSHRQFYAVTTYGKRISMHRLILGLNDPSIIVDHRDRNGLNNQRNNIRQANKSQNAQNKIGTGEIKYLGVYVKKYKDSRYFIAQIKTAEKNTYIGIYKTPEEAAMAYDRMAKMHHGEFANLNFAS